MYRLAHISDTHVCDRLRPADLIRVLRAFLKDAAEARVNLIVHSGDFFDRRSSPQERIDLADFLERCADIADVFGVRGNHDAPQDVELFNRIEGKHRITICERPTLPGEHIAIGDLDGRAIFGAIALPWFDKAHIVSGLEATTDQEATRQMTNEAAERLLRGLQSEATLLREGGLIPIVVGHLMVAGSEMSTGQIIQGTTVELTPASLYEIGAEYVALGHVHKTQEWFGGQVAYAGSPVRHNFGEPEEKGWRLVTFSDDGAFVSNEFRPLPAREIVLIETDFPADHVDLGDVSRLKGALVRFRYHVNAAHLHEVNEDALRAIFLEEAGAAEVKIEAVVEHTNRVRSEAITVAQTTADKILAYFDAKGEQLEAATIERLNQKLSEIEREGP